MRGAVTLSYNNIKLTLSHDKMNNILYYSINDSETIPIQLNNTLSSNLTFLVHLIAASLDVELPIIHEL